MKTKKNNHSLGTKPETPLRPKRFDSSSSTDVKRSQDRRDKTPDANIDRKDLQAYITGFRGAEQAERQRILQIINLRIIGLKNIFISDGNKRALSKLEELLELKQAIEQGGEDELVN